MGHISIRDTLPPELQVSSVSSPFSSHPHDFCVTEGNVLIWEFAPIFLPDTAYSWRFSSGFVQFNCIMQPDLPFGTVIENHAAISFNHATPVKTNTTAVHVVEALGVKKPPVHHTLLALYPNPSNGYTTVAASFEMQEVSLYDAMGRLVLHEQVPGTSTLWTSAGLLTASTGFR